MRFVFGVLAAALTAHVVVSLVVAASLDVMHSHRVFDVRRFSDDAATNFRLLGTFLNVRAKRTDRPTVVFAGSSVTFGNLWHERVTFAGVFASRHPDLTVLNASIIAGDVSSINDWIVCAARRNRIAVDVAVIELPVVNSLSYLIDHQHAGLQPSPLSRCEGPPDRGYLGVAATTVRGAGWARFLWNRMHSSTTDRPMRVVPLPKGYFASAADFAAVKDGFTNRIVATLTNAQSVAAVVYAFPSPVFVAGLQEHGQDADAVADQLQSALDACRSAAAVRCIDTSPLYGERRYYDNFTHLNMAGHRAMADLIEDQVGR